ncbi:MAG: cryptochrome/photolyase family protein [Planctomycetota bacterium]
MRTLHWFRNDLRLDDNTALQAATRSGDEPSAVFLIADRQWQEHDWSRAKVALLQAHLTELAKACRQHGIRLLLRRAPSFADAATSLVGICRELGIDRVHWNREYGVDEQQRDRAVEQGLADMGVAWQQHDDATVLPPETVRTQDDRPYQVYSPFARRWRSLLTERGFSCAPTPPPRKARRGASVPQDFTNWRSLQVPEGWVAGEAAVHRQLQEFLEERLRHYHQQRDEPGHDGTSRLSAHLSLGAISPRRCVAAAQAAAAEADTGADTWLGQLIWREFYRQILQAFPRVSRHRAFKPETEHIRWRRSETDFQAWCEGRTGIPLVDAGMRQLQHSGWMHNRLRMVAAQFLSKNLLIDWRRGERHFMQHLIDGDLANNNGGWQWAASTGTDAAPYFRVFNPVSQSRRFDPDGHFLRRWLPELAHLDRRQIHEPKPGSADYPRSIVDLKASRQRAIEAFRAT